MADEETYDFDPWETSSGLPDKLRVRIENPHFTFNAEINDGNTCLFVPEGTVLSGDGIDEPTEFNQFFGCGPGWEPQGKGGTRVVREDGKAKRFNNNVAYAHLFTSLLKQATAQGMDDALRKRGTPYEAAMWQSMVLDLKRIDLPSFTGKDGNEVKRNVLVVENIVQMGDVKGNDSASASSATSAASEEVTASASVGQSTSAAESASTNGLDPKVKAKLRAAARTATSHAQFVELAFDVEGVLDDPAAEQAVMDEGEGSIYATVKAEG
jgi:hypothetical protein